MPRAKIVMASSASVRSPTGTYTASVSTRWTASNVDEGVSQAVVDGPRGGSGLVAFAVPRVPMSFTWNGDDELVVGYPDDLPAPRIDATNSSFGRGGRGRVVHRPVLRTSIAPERWTASGELLIASEEPIGRGRLVRFEADGRVDYAYSYHDAHEPDSSSGMLRARGLQGGGETWAGIVVGLITLRAPAIRGELELDPEADGLSIRSADRDALVTVAALIAAAKEDPALLDAAIACAAAEGAIE